MLPGKLDPTKHWATVVSLCGAFCVHSFKVLNTASYELNQGEQIYTAECSGGVPCFIASQHKAFQNNPCTALVGRPFPSTLPPPRGLHVCDRQAGPSRAHLTGYVPNCTLFPIQCTTFDQLPQGGMLGIGCHQERSPSLFSVVHFDTQLLSLLEH